MELYNVINLMDTIQNHYIEELKDNDINLTVVNNFSIEELLYPLYNKNVFSVKFILRKKTDTSILLTRLFDDNKKLILYFDEFNIIKTLIHLGDNNEKTYKHIYDSFIMNLNDEDLQVTSFKFNDENYEINGIAYIDDFEIFNTFADVEINSNDFICLLNLIIEKEKLNKSKHEGKSTICKYMLFSQMFVNSSNNITLRKDEIIKKFNLEKFDSIEEYSNSINIYRKKSEIIIDPNEFIKFL